MVFILIVEVILSITGLMSLYYLTKIFHPIEIIAYFLVVSELSEQLYGIIVNNLGMIESSKQIAVFWSMCAKLYIIVPCLTMWLFYVYFLQRTPLFVKALLTGGWFLGLYGIELLLYHLGFITFKRWEFRYSFIEWLIVWSGSLGFIFLLRKLLRKQVGT